MNTPIITESGIQKRPPWRGIFTLIALLSIIYTLSNSGGFHIIDEASRFAVTESLALRGSVDTNAIAWTQWVNSRLEAQGDLGPNGDVYSKKGPAQPILTTLWYLLLLIPTRILRLPFLSEQLASSFGMLQWAMLFPGWVTAITAALVWRVSVQLRYTERVGALLGLLFGLTTIAWPYATYLLAEPFSALFLLTCFYGLVRWRNALCLHQEDPADDQGGTRWLWLAGTAAGVAVATIVIHIFPVIILCFYWLALAIGAFKRKVAIRPQPIGMQIRTLVRWGIPILIPMLVTAGLMLAYNFVRFDRLWHTGYHVSSGEFFTTPLWEGVWGLLVSPYRSFFLHSPILILCLFAFPLFYRQHRLEALVFVGISITVIALYAKYWLWWGGFAWGPRFLVPLAPFWILLLAPMLSRWLPDMTASSESSKPNTNKLSRPERFAMGGVWTLAILSTIVQLSAVVVNFVNFETKLRGIFPTDWLDPLEYGPPAMSLADLFYSPVIGQWRLIFSNPIVNSDLAWLRADGKVLWPILGVGGLGVLLTGASLIAWWNRSTQMPTANRQNRLPSGIPAWLSVVLALTVMLFWTNQVSSDPRYGVQDEEYRAILNRINQEGAQEDAIVTVAPYHYTVPMNWFQSSVPIYGYAVDSMQYAETQTLLTSVIEQHSRIWFITAGLPPADPNNSVERWLSQVSYKADDQWYNNFRLVRYATAASAYRSQKSTVDALLRDADNGVQLISVGSGTAAEAGQMLPVEITFQLEESAEQNLRWFVQMLNSAGEAVAMTDRASQGGYRNFVDLPTSQPLTEKIGLQLPSDLSAGEYRLIAGLYNPERGGERLVTANGDDFVILRKLTIPSDERPN